MQNCRMCGGEKHVRMQVNQPGAPPEFFSGPPWGIPPIASWPRIALDCWCSQCGAMYHPQSVYI